MNNAITGIVAIIMAVIGVAIVAVLVSKNSNTAGVLTSGGSAFSGILGTALSPVSGNNGLSTSNLTQGFSFLN